MTVEKSRTVKWCPEVQAMIEAGHNLAGRYVYYEPSRDCWCLCELLEHIPQGLYFDSNTVVFQAHFEFGQGDFMKPIEDKSDDRPTTT